MVLTPSTTVTTPSAVTAIVTGSAAIPIPVASAAADPLPPEIVVISP